MSDLTDRFRSLLKPNAAWYALLAALGLTAIGIAALGTAEPQLVPVQIKWLGFAMVAMVAAMVVHPRQLCRLVNPLMVITILLLVLLVTPGVPAWLVPRRNGARSWINLQYMNFQPSELAKIVFVLALAKYLRFRENYRTLGGLLMPFLIMVVPVALIMIEPDLGSAILFVPALFVMLVAAGAKLKHMGALVGLALLAGVLTVVGIYTLPEGIQGYLLKKHQRQRIVSTISLVRGDKSQLQGANFQQDKAMNLIGSAGLRGYGASRSQTIVRLNGLPHPHNDMIFAVIVNRWGLLGGMMTLGLYLALILFFLAVAARLKDPFARLVTVGLAGFIFPQTAINIAMTLGLMPITGITLPLVSYGGTSLAATYAMVGLVVNFAARPPAILARPSFEYGKAQAIAG